MEDKVKQRAGNDYVNIRRVFIKISKTREYLRSALDFIEKDQCFPRNDRRIRIQGEVLQNRLDFFGTKQVSFCRSLVEIYLYVVKVLFGAEFPNQKRFADLPGTTDDKRLPGFTVLPFGLLPGVFDKDSYPSYDIVSIDSFYR